MIFMTQNLKTIMLAVSVACITSACISTEKLDRSNDAKTASRTSLPNIPNYWISVQQKDGDKIKIGWLKQFNDPILEALVDEAIANNRNLQVAAANVDSTRALLGQAAASLTPNVNLVTTSSRSGMVESNASNNLGLGIEASWEIDLWGRIRSGNKAAQQSLMAAEADYLYAQYSLAANVAQAYFFAIEANSTLNIARQSIDALAEINRIIQVQFDNGVGNQQNVSLAKSDLANARDSLIASKGAQRDAIRSLELLLGRYPQAELQVLKLLPEVPATAPTGIPSEILERRPDIIAKEREIAAAFNSVDAAKAAKLPTLSLSGSFGGSSNALTSLLDPSNLAWQAASNLVAPLFDGGRLDAEIAKATASQKAAIANYAQTALNAFSEVETALDQNVALRERISALTEALQESEQALRIANLQFKEGEISLLDVLTIQQRVFAARSNLLSIKRLSLSQYIALNLALGGSW